MPIALTEEELRKRKKYGLAGQTVGQEKPQYPTIISGSKQDPNDPNVLRGDKEGAYKGPERKKRQGFLRSLWRMMNRG
jgi:hypothetical protein